MNTHTKQNQAEPRVWTGKPRRGFTIDVGPRTRRRHPLAAMPGTQSFLFLKKPLRRVSTLKPHRFLNPRCLRINGLERFDKRVAVAESAESLTSACSLNKLRIETHRWRNPMGTNACPALQVSDLNPSGCEFEKAGRAGSSRTSRAAKRPTNFREAAKK